jgi:hypothetical protein
LNRRFREDTPARRREAWAARSAFLAAITARATPATPNRRGPRMTQIFAVKRKDKGRRLALNVLPCGVSSALRPCVNFLVLKFIAEARRAQSRRELGKAVFFSVFLGHFTGKQIRVACANSERESCRSKQQIEENEVSFDGALGLRALPCGVSSALRPLRLYVSFLVLKIVARRGAESAEQKRARKSVFRPCALGISLGNKSARPAPILNVSRADQSSRSRRTRPPFWFGRISTLQNVST